MDQKTVILAHMDYGDGEHGYVLYRVNQADTDEAAAAVTAAHKAYIDGGMKGVWDEQVEAALKQAGIEFDILDYDVLDLVF